MTDNDNGALREVRVGEPKLFTPTGQRFHDLLKDGKPHAKWELHNLLWDEDSRMATIQHHISVMRRVLRPKGLDILCTFHERQNKYQLVRIVNAGE